MFFSQVVYVAFFSCNSHTYIQQDLAGENGVRHPRRSAGQKYGPTCHQRDRADVTEFVTLVRLSSLGQHVGVLALAGYKRRKSALTANPITTGYLGSYTLLWGEAQATGISHRPAARRKLNKILSFCLTETLLVLLEYLDFKVPTKTLGFKNDPFISVCICRQHRFCWMKRIKLQLTLKRKKNNTTFTSMLHLKTLCFHPGTLMLAIPPVLYKNTRSN